MIDSGYACQYAMGAVAFQGMIFDVVKVFIPCWFLYKIIKLIFDKNFDKKLLELRKQIKEKKQK